MSKDFLAEALPKRPVQKTNKFKSNGGFSTSLDSTRVSVSTNITGGTYSAPTLEGVEFDRMRRYGLTLARWSLPDHAKRAKKASTPVSCYESANRVVANKMFAKTFGEDPTQDTVNLTPYVNAINSGKITPDLIHNLSGFIGTHAFTKVLNSIKPTPIGVVVRSDLQEMASTIVDNCLDESGWLFRELDNLHSESRRRQRSATYIFDNIADIIARKTDSMLRKIDKPPAKPKPQRKREKPDKPVRLQELQGEDGWCKPYLAKYPLELPHTGKMGRKIIATNEGKYPKNFHRLVTDPFRRIFVRKTRSLGGVVVFDCSGSMALSDEQIKQVLKSSAGCSIVCYSDHGDEDQDKEKGNIHLIARNGRQMRGLPDFPGGNGVDLPALRYGYDHLRLNGRSPVIWVSDGQVTGTSGSFRTGLKNQVDRFIERRGIYHVQTPEEAVKLLTKLQKGITR